MTFMIIYSFGDAKDGGKAGAEYWLKDLSKLVTCLPIVLSALTNSGF